MDNYREIEKLIYCYAERLDGGDLAGVAALFKHAEFFGPDGSLAATGEQEFLALQHKAIRIYPPVSGAGSGTPRTKHVTTNVIIDVDDDGITATARSYFTVMQATDKLSLQPIIAGRYVDGFECIEDRWQFRRRQSIPELLGDLSQHLLFNLKPS